MKFGYFEGPKRWFLSRTIFIGVLEVLLGVIGLITDQVSGGQDWTMLSTLAVISGSLKIVLRIITTQPLGS